MTDMPPPLVGAFALQGDFESHIKAALAAFPGARGLEIRGPRDIPAEGLDLFLLPGGESSAMSLLMDFSAMWEPVKALIGNPRTITLATCAGAIITAKNILNPGRARSMGIVDIAIERNAYGRQIDSFIGRLEPAPALEALARDSPLAAAGNAAMGLEAVFIRAPVIRATGPGVLVLATVGGLPVLVRQGNVLSATFHPEKSEGSVVYAALASMLAARS
jgi:5'-phosphate synthase pdxT subunit